MRDFVLYWLRAGGVGLLRPTARAEIMGGASQLCCPGVLLFFGALILMQGTGGKKKIDAIQAKLVDNSFIEGDDVQEDSCSETGIVTCEMTQAEKYASGSAEQNGTDWSKGKGGLPVDIYVYSVLALILKYLEESQESLRAHMKSSCPSRVPS